MKALDTKLAILLLSVAGCFGNTSHPSTQPTETGLACDPSTQQTGAYLWQTVTLSGNCGDIPERVVDWPAQNQLIADQGSTCSTISDALTDNNCKNTWVWTCSNSGSTSYYTRVLTQETADGSSLTGISSEQLGPPLSCSGTYSITLTRQ